MNEVRTRKEKLSKQDIVFLFKKGRIFRQGSCLLRWDFAAAESPLFCVTTKKNSFASAVKRNRMRRVAKEFFRHQAAYVKKNARIVLQLGGFRDIKSGEFSSELGDLFRRAGLLDDKKNCNRTD